MRKEYEEPAAEVLIVQMENIILYGKVNDFNENEDDIFGDGND